jgi:ATP-dependent Clp protease protease subunit
MIHYLVDPKLKIKKIEEIIDPPVIILVNKFDEPGAKTFREDMQKAINTGQKVIPVMIDSYGGQVYSLMSMIDTIKSSPVPVATVSSGKSMSCGSALLSCGTEGLRFMDRNATVMIHSVSSMTFGKLDEIKADAKETERLNNLIFHTMARNIGKADDFFLKAIHDKNHADWFLTSEECKEINLVNHIRVPKFTVKLSTDLTFE